jgi:hypothetical protein
MKKFSLALFALAIAFAITPTVMADTYYYHFNDGNITASGTLSAIEIGNTGVYEVTDGTININFGNGVLTGVLDQNPNLPNPFSPPCPWCGGIDNLLYPSGNAPSQFNNLLLDKYGLLFTVNGTYGYTNLWGGDNNGYGAAYSTNAAWSAYGGGTFEISTTPEPGSLFLLGTGLLGLAVIIFRKSKPSNLVFHT